MHPKSENGHCLTCKTALDGSCGRRYCSDKCKTRASYLSTGQYWRSSASAICSNCKTEFRPKATNRTKFCSRGCYFVSIKAKPVEKPAPREATVRECAECGNDFASLLSSQIICSGECRKARNNRISKERSDLEYATRPEVSKNCAECGDAFNVKVTNGNQVFCSPSCSHKSGKRIRKFKERSGRKAIERPRFTAIYDRDNGKCHVCGIATIRKTAGYHPLRATLDHVFPVSKRGDHAESNLAIAHNLCNTLKSDAMQITDEFRELCRGRVLSEVAA